MLHFCYLIDSFVWVANSDGGWSVKPASPFAAAMFIKRDKQRGGVFWFPSNQDVKGILGTARPISYFDGEIDHEANRLNQADIATFIPARLSQNAHGKIVANGRILWGNHTTSSDPLWRFVNVVRTRAADGRAWWERAASSLPNDFTCGGFTRDSRFRCGIFCLFWFYWDSDRSGWGGYFLCCGGIFTPIGAVVAAVVAVILAAGFALWKYWDRFSSFVKGFARGIAHAFSRAFEAVMRFFGADTTTITRWKNIIANAFDLSQVWQKFKQELSSVAEWFGNLWEGVKQSFSNFWQWLKSFFTQEKLSESAKAGMEQAGEDLANWIVDGFMSSISQLMDFCKSLPSRIKGWIGSIDVREFLPSFLGGKTAIQPIAQFAGAGHANYSVREQRDKDRSPITHNQNVTVHVNGAREPMATGRAVAHALQRARANALHGGTE